jgi:hypothetical protein
MSAATESVLPEVTVEIVASVAEHRVLSTPQLHAIHFPASGVRWAQRVLLRLHRAGLLAKVRPQHAPRRLWFITEKGAQLALEAGALSDPPKVFGPEAAIGQLQRHTLAVNDAAICFLAAGRERGDEFGPLSWRHEIAHPLGVGRHRRLLIPDVVLTYLRVGEGRLSIEQRFLELDRATLAVDRLAAKLGRYADLYRAQDKAHEPIWKARYPSFPPVLCVLAGASRSVLERRRATTIALLRSNPNLNRTPQAEVFICLLEDLRDRGPFAPIFLTPRDQSGPLEWCDRPGQTEKGKR